MLVALAWVCTPLLRSQPGPASVFDYTVGTALAASPAIGLDGTLYFGAPDSRLYAVQPNGTARWILPLGARSQATPALGADGTIYIGTVDGHFHAVSATGQTNWTFAARGEIDGSAAVGIDGTVYFGALDGHLYAVNPDGSKRWEYTAGGPIFSSPAIAGDGTIYFGARDGLVYAVNPDGSARWTFSTGGRIEASPAVGPGGVVFIGSTDRHFYAINPDRSKLWDFAAPAEVYSSAAVGLDGRVYFGDAQGLVHALQGADGTELWSTNLTAPVAYSSPALASDGSLYIGTQDGLLTALTSDGRVKWTNATTARINFASAVISPAGVVYVASESGHVIGWPASAGPAAAAWPMFGRDPRHTAGGFVDRVLPPGYSPGGELIVTLAATVPPTGVDFYSVEDTPPANWQVGEISDNGFFDAVNGRVKFGPFLDGQSRRLTYTLTPPIGESGLKFFAGTSTANGADRLLGGTHVLAAIPLHPADNGPVDGWITLAEFTGYAAAWKRGTSWNLGPNPVPAAYLNRAVEIWSSGEAYAYDTNFTSAPSWWTTNLPAGPPLALPPAVTNTTAGNGSIFADMPVAGQPGTNFLVELTVTPATNVVVFAVEDQPPAGWVVSDISSAGFLDTVRGKVKWGPFFDSTPRSLSYRVTVPASASGLAEFQGAAAFDGNIGTIAGTRRFYTGSDQGGDIFVLRQLPATYSPGAQLAVVLHALPPPGSGWYLVEEEPPAGWQVGFISDGGYFDPTSQTVKFGPYLDDLPRDLLYEATPGLSETGLHQFVGTSQVDGVEAMVGGDEAVNLMPLFPGDAQPIDGWLTITELTAYGAAWKQGSGWSLPPSPVPTSYLTHAIALWLGGEAYTYDASITNLPLAWVNLTNAFPPEAVPVAIPPGATTPNGTIQADTPRFYDPTQPVLVTLTVTPAVGTHVQAIEETTPAGWSVAAVSSGGRWDSRRGKLKWGPFFDGTNRFLTYQVLPPTNSADIVVFQGGAAFDGAPAAATGRRQIYRLGAPVAPVFTDVSLIPGAGCQVVFAGVTNEVYLLQSSSDLVSWNLLGTFTNSVGAITNLDPAGLTLPQNFYRVLWP